MSKNEKRRLRKKRGQRLKQSISSKGKLEFTGLVAIKLQVGLRSTM